MKIKAGAIYRAKNAKLGMADYSRPFIVLRASGTDADICFFSTKFELIEAGDVTLEHTDPDFKASGLKEDSYLVERSSHPVNLDFFNGATPLGVAAGEFKKRAEKMWGATLD